MFYAARVQLVEIRLFALARGQRVIGDRRDLSTQAYQGGGRELAHDAGDAERRGLPVIFAPI